MDIVTRNIGDKITFNLDNSPHTYGEGIIENFGGDHYIVKLTADCKEFQSGYRIAVFFDEINK